MRLGVRSKSVVLCTCPQVFFRLLPSLSAPTSAHRLAEAVQRLGAENEQLKRENERLARVIDSGDWSRQRVQELLEAGRVMQAERDALQKLVGAAAAGGPAAALSSGYGGGSGGYARAEYLGQQAPPLSDATNSPEVTPAAVRSPSLAGSGDYEGGVLQRYHVSAGIQPGGAAGGGSAISAVWGSITGGDRQGMSSARSTSPAARNKLLVGGLLNACRVGSKALHLPLCPFVLLPATLSNAALTCPAVY